MSGTRKQKPKPYALSLEPARFLGYSLNSARELEYHLRLAKDLSLIPLLTSDSLKQQVEEVQKMLHGFIARLTAERPTK
jgi:four helix bundle protein